MTIQEKYKEMQIRIHSADNYEKYENIFSGENNNHDEEMFLIHSSKLSE